ncbi:hypothetical protein PFISCL1PPCAC_7853, partial [Pristionchus fissidentatus]
PLSAHKVMVYMQVIGEELKSEQIGLYQNDTVIVGCESKDGIITVMNSTYLNKKSTPVLYEDFSNFKPKHSVCVITIDRFDKIKWKDIIQDIKLTRLVYEPATSQPRPDTAPNGTLPHGMVQHGDTDHIFYDATRLRKLSSLYLTRGSLNSSNSHRSIPTEKGWRKINCDHIKSHELGVKYKYRIFIQNKDETVKEADELVCNSDKTFVGKTGSGDFEIAQPEFSAFCGVEISKTCTNVRLPCTPDVDCPKYSEGNITHDAMLECDGGKWLIDNEYYEGIHPVCKDDEMSANSGLFYMHFKDGRISKLTEGRCFQEYDCEKNAKLDISPQVTITNGTMKCSEGEMRVQHGNTTYNEQKYTCDKMKGTWKSENNKVIKDNSRVMCVQ